MLFLRKLSTSYYDILKVPKEASIAQIKKAFFDIAKKYHPDTNKDPDAPKKFIEAKKAYEILSDPNKRKEYDFTGSTENFDEATDSSYSNKHHDIFNDFYRNFSHFDVFEELFKTQQTRDLEVNYNIDFITASKGGSIVIRIPRLVSCEKCNGSGFSQKTRTQCSNCKGSGNCTEIRGGFIFSSICKLCKGSGRSIKDNCSECKGNSFYFIFSKKTR